MSLHPATISRSIHVRASTAGAEATGLKTNDLLQDVYPYTLEAGGTYFMSMLMLLVIQKFKIARDSALKVLENKAYQTHQITRVVPNCRPTIGGTTEAKPVAPPALVLEQPVSIELKVHLITIKPLSSAVLPRS